MARDTLPAVAAVDVGGTTLKGGLVGPGGTLEAITRVPTPRDGDGQVDPDGVVDAIGQLLATLRATGEGRVVGFGVCTPGIVDGEAGVVRAAANLGWREVALRERLRAATGLDGAVTHDMRAAGIAEWRLGGARGLHDFCFMALGTGISAALVVDGRVVQGGGWAGEIGHASFPAAAGVACPCGGTGCLETVASASGVRRTAARLRGTAVADEPSTEALADLARCGDDVARRAFDLAGRALAEASAMLVTLLGPERLVFGGGMAQALDLVTGPITTTLAALPFQRRTTLARAELGPDAGLLGAGLAGAEAKGERFW
ncbi:ROK family protein [Mariniluteicoccus flavus]